MKSDKKEKNTRPTLPRLLEYIKPHSGWLALSMSCAAASVIFTLFIPVLTGDIIDLCVGAGKVELSAFPPMLIKLGVCVLAAASAGLLSSYFNNRITFRCARELRMKAFARITGAPLSLLDSAPSGELINRVTSDIDYVSDGLLHAFTQLFTGVAAICGTLVFMLRASARASLPVILLTPLSIAVAAVIARGSYKYFSRQTATQADMSGYLDEYVGRAGLVKAFGREKAACDGFDKINSELYKCGYMAQVYSALVNPSTRLVNNFVFAAVGVTGALIACRGGLSVGQITMFLAYASQYAKPFNEISSIAAQLTAALASADRVFKLIDTPFEDTNDLKEPLKKRSPKRPAKFRKRQLQLLPTES